MTQGIFHSPVRHEQCKLRPIFILILTAVYSFPRQVKFLYDILLILVVSQTLTLFIGEGQANIILFCYYQHILELLVV